jgi:4-hydroxybenzoate polyprenyltransferase
MKERDARDNRGRLRVYLGVARPDHWFKNLLVLAGGTVVLWRPDIDVGPSLLVAWRLACALLVTCLASGANYIINEILDGPRDKLHPVKRFRPVPANEVSSGRLWVLAGLFALTSAGTAWLLLPWQSFLWVLGFLLIGGGVYNVPPVRAKEIPYADVIVESANGPIRLALGWYAVTTTLPPPLMFLLSCWALAAFVMAGKRYAEYRFISDPSRAAAYRSSFRWYTERSLMAGMIGYALLSVVFFVLLVLGSGQDRLLWMIPFIVVFVAWFIRLSARKEAFVREPEHIWERPAFAGYCIGMVILFALLGFSGG